MTISRESIVQRKSILQNDIVTAKQRLVEHDKKRQEDTALINALTGAFQLCEGFLKELDNESSDDGNDSMAVS
ncbi:uncharacterized protein METZ01_LOCUS511456 [marine metagenome]|uniref:Uncharacterized protein n=1 Tax=marine metagenome TaxID=408172 RepID=A0A383ENW3_9ZZZZ